MWGRTGLSRAVAVGEPVSALGALLYWLTPFSPLEAAGVGHR